MTPPEGVYSALLYGRPTTLGTSIITLQVEDGLGDAARQIFSIACNSTPSDVITVPNPRYSGGTVGTSYAQNVFLSGGGP